jgi:hypothetical protein
LEIGVVLEVVGVYGGDVVWGTSGSGVFLFIGGQITPDVRVLILHLRCSMLIPLYIVVNSFTYTTTRSIRNENRLKSTKFATLVCGFGILPPRFFPFLPENSKRM